VIDHRKVSHGVSYICIADHQEWSTFIAEYGKMSWSRLGDERGRLQVGLHFMMNVAKTDPSAFSVSPPSRKLMSADR
jgi:hypothetical protein